ncbi:MAG: hypothetical protein WBL45_05175 [Solirubrobacterales bacterium]
MAPVVLAALTGLLMASPLPSQAAAPNPSPDSLTKADARRAASRIAKEFARANDSVTSAAVGGCRRRAADRIDCLAVSQGNTTTTKTVCRLRIAVHATSGDPRAELLSSKCQTQSRFELTEAEALVTLLGKMKELVGQPVQVSALERASQTSFRARADWTRSEATGATSKCTALLTVTLRSPGVVELSVLVVDCSTGQAPSPPIYK